MSLQEDSLPGEQLLRSDVDRPLFVSDDEDVWELGPRQTRMGWLRLGLALGCLGAVGVLTGQRFLNYVVNHVWDHSRNSPAALIVPVVAVELLWIIAHVHTGGLIARLKIGFGAAAICVAIFAPSAQALSQGGGPSVDLRQLVGLLLASWVFVDGWRDRRGNMNQEAQQALRTQSQRG